MGVDECFCRLRGLLRDVSLPIVSVGVDEIGDGLCDGGVVCSTAVVVEITWTSSSVVVSPTPDAVLDAASLIELVCDGLCVGDAGTATAAGEDRSCTPPSGDSVSGNMMCEEDWLLVWKAS